MSYDFGFQFDGFLDYEEYTQSINDSNMRLIMSDPVIYPFHNGTRTVGSSVRLLRLEGEGLNCCTKTDFHVFIGEHRCNVTKVTEKMIECSLFEILSKLKASNSTEHYVSVGDELYITVGNIVLEIQMF